MASQLNTFAGNCLNRTSWLREDGDFVRSAVTSDSARFLLLHELNPLCHEQDGDLRLKLLAWSEVEPHLDGQKPNVLRAYSEERGPIDVDAVDVTPLLVFLGVDESGRDTQHALPSKEETACPTDPAIFAVDATRLATLREAALKGDGKPEFAELRGASSRLPAHESAVGAEARAVLSWNRSNRFCAGCGRPTVSVWAGWKRACLPDDEMASATKPPCVTRKGVHSFSYPRTDAVCITGVTDSTGDKILLGRQRSWPKGFYSCLAGFIEPAETLEDAVAREIFEESGLRVREVRYVASQPWPFPSSLMFGCLATAEDGQQIRTDLDNELEDARWFDRADILRALDSNAASFTRAEIDKLEAAAGEKAGPSTPDAMANVRLPPRTAIAHVLIALWARKQLPSTPAARM